MSAGEETGPEMNIPIDNNSWVLYPNSNSASMPSIEEDESLTNIQDVFDSMERPTKANKKRDETSGFFPVDRQPVAVDEAKTEQATKAKKDQEARLRSRNEFQVVTVKTSGRPTALRSTVLESSALCTTYLKGILDSVPMSPPRFNRLSYRSSIVGMHWSSLNLD
ncbi:hypothetical protein K469DRAFT_690919 [Zopfia rhizophila CBS 207.26]|uniref:Uncharacterized protein n=1 Tax=Zopfia rhizophila CBS 207.26 TaxID=1314779 RepID=A0A6A6DS98_9PEZI|nr:hypothetical protein K469DRAFT_690919 [Zopfia rhizophila CBS 207.26]